MKTKHIILTFFMMLSYFGESQDMPDTKDSLRIVKGMIGDNVFVVGDSVVQRRYFQNTIKSNYEANEFFRKGSNLNILSTIFGVAGGGAIGFTLGRLISDGNPNLLIGVAGLVVLIIHIPIKRASKYNFKQATSTYNSGLNNNTSFWDKSDVNFFVTGSIIGFNVKF